MISRRTFLQSLSAAAIGGTVAAAARHATSISFSFSLYGMKSLSLSQALKVCADIGYSGVEIPCMKDWPADPAVLTPNARVELRRQLQDLSLELPCLMENLLLVCPAEQHRANRDRIKQMAELASDLAVEGRCPIMETVLGGKAEQWDALKNRMVDALGDWSKTATAEGIQIAIKAHAFNAAHRPEDILWLVRQVNSPSIKVAYDYSHFQRQGLELAPSLRLLAPETIFVHVKDNVTTEGKTEFALPGDGDIDYREYLRLLVAENYRGAVCVEVSAQVSTKPGYNPIIAAERCYANLHPAFERAGQRARV